MNKSVFTFALLVAVGGGYWGISLMEKLQNGENWQAIALHLVILIYAIAFIHMTHNGYYQAFVDWLYMVIVLTAVFGILATFFAGMMTYCVGLAVALVAFKWVEKLVYSN